MPRQFEALKNLLMQRAARLADLRERDRNPPLTDVSCGTQDAYGNSGDSELADWATDLYDRTLTRSMDAHHRDELRAVQAALGRLDRGTYGQCIRCAQTIPLGRLNAVPENPWCLMCALDVEAEG
jgi:DnaK suppressor protein